MNNERNSLLPENEEASPKMEYNDLKYPLLQRGIPIPSGLEDYIRLRVADDTLSDDEIDAIRKEMLQVFGDAEQGVPPDFEENFKKWFPRA